MYRYDRVLPAVHAYGFFWRYRAIKDIAQITSYRDAIGVFTDRLRKTLRPTFQLSNLVGQGYC